MTDQTHYYGDGCAHHRKDSAVPVEYLVYRDDIVSMLNIQRATLNRWVERRRTTSFPAPLKGRSGQAEIYDWQEVNAWWLIWTRAHKSYWRDGQSTRSQES